MLDGVQNIDCFNRACVHILGLLYGEFPRPAQVNADEILESFRNFPQECKWDDQFQGNVVACTLRFLGDEGFIRYSGESTGEFVNVILTSKGLAVLNRVPDSLTQDRFAKRKNLGEQMREVRETFTNEAAAILIKALFNWMGLP